MRFTGRYFKTELATYREFITEDGRAMSTKTWLRSGQESANSGLLRFHTVATSYRAVILFEPHELLKTLKRHL